MAWTLVADARRRLTFEDVPSGALVLLAGAWPLSFVTATPVVGLALTFVAPDSCCSGE